MCEIQSILLADQLNQKWDRNREQTDNREHKCEMPPSSSNGRTHSIIDCFSNLAGKADKTFIKFDIVEFYPSITEDLLDKAITHAKSVVDITE